MIYTLTLNPCIDHIIYIDEFEKGKINKCINEDFISGGKGINVSRVLNILGKKNKSFGFVGGQTGSWFKKILKKEGIKTDFVMVKNGNTRVNTKIKSIEETDLNSIGLTISKEEIKKLFKKLKKLKKGDFLVLAGSLPNGVDNTIYRDLIELLKPKGVKIIVDTTKEALVNAVKKGPFLIKPNEFELGEVFNVVIKTDEDVVKYSKELIKMGAENVLVSLGEKGAMIIASDGEVIKKDAIKGEVKNTTGAGDSLVAGFLYEYENTKDLKKALDFSVVVSGANAFSKTFATKEEIYKLIK